MMKIIEKIKKVLKDFKFWIAIAIILFIINIALASIFRGEQGANIFTAISGWISGVATVVLGVIAVWQNKNYKQENDEVMSKQGTILEEQRKLLTEQKDLLKQLEDILKALDGNQKQLLFGNLQYQLFATYLNMLIKQKNRLMDNSFEKIHSDLIGLPYSDESYNKILCECDSLIESLSWIINFADTLKNHFGVRDDLINRTKSYIESIKNYKNFLILGNGEGYREIYNLLKIEHAEYTKDQKNLYKRFNDVFKNTSECYKVFNESFDKYLNDIFEAMSNICYNSI